MSGKQRIQLTLDCDIVDAAKDRYLSVSNRVNELLAMDMYGSDEKDELVNRLHELKLEEKSITKRICELEKKEVIIQENGSNIQEIMEWVNTIYSRKGVVGLNKVEAECKRKHVSFDEIKQILDAEEIAYVKYS
ncbi:hypothetical protein [Methanobrevibacter sp. V74]|uniref:hypothetical protein n=1 Tax=Methanobrevibacter sp. V74 TaxID=3064279 RepID=UPI002736DFF3|nr:hypothetical protein [Methanobrevibacter sp. V74]